MRKSIVCHLAFIEIILILASSCEKGPFSIEEPKFNQSITYGSMTDQEGNTYKTVNIGDQIWMAENLKTTKYRNGELIPKVVENSEWESITTGAYCNYDNQKSFVNTYGRLYNWFAITDSRNLAPAGWHVATDTDWTTLINYLGGEREAGVKLEETGTTHWKTESGATNESGFTALPGGYRSDQTIFYIQQPYHYSFLGLYGWWWSSTESTSTLAWSDWISLIIHRSLATKQWGLSVRCVKD
jgi:uncharacterized protein (TIGR02145 family)